METCWKNDIRWLEELQQPEGGYRLVKLDTDDVLLCPELRDYEQPYEIITRDGFGYIVRRQMYLPENSIKTSYDVDISGMNERKLMGMMKKNSAGLIQIATGIDRKYEKEVQDWIGKTLDRAVACVVLGHEPRFFGDERVSLYADITEYEFKVLHSHIRDLVEIVEPELVDQVDRQLRFVDGMEVNRQGDDESDGIECPFCGYEVARNDDYPETRPKHCPECGTKLIY